MLFIQYLMGFYDLVEMRFNVEFDSNLYSSEIQTFFLFCLSVEMADQCELCCLPVDTRLLGFEAILINRFLAILFSAVVKISVI